MRNFDLKIIFSLLLISCAPRPEKTTASDHVHISQQDEGVKEQVAQKAIWISTTNYSSGGALERLDLQTGDITHGVLATGPDVQIFQDKLQDGKEGLFLLTRMHQDSVTTLSGSKAQVVGQTPLPENSNPQSVARDSMGRVWVTSMDSNSVQIFSPDLKSPVGSVDLSALKEENSTDGFAELAQVIAVDADRMAVSAQRLRRSVSYWKPEAQSGLSVVNIHTLKSESTSFIPAANPNLLFAHLSPVTQDAQVYVIGSGDLGSAQGAASGITLFSTQQQSTVSTVNYSYRILAADLHLPTEPPAIIAWYQADKKSCVQIGDQKLVCEGSDADGGYVFNKILRYGNSIFVSYVAMDTAQLWVIPVSDYLSEPAALSQIQKLNMSLPISSMSFGP